MTTIKSITIGALAVLLAATACGGAQKTSTKEMSEQAKKAPPPPDKVEPGKKIERKVTRAAAADFKVAVDYYNQAMEGGWTADECNNAAQKFIGVANEHDKVVEAWFNAGVSYQNCGMTKDAESQYKNALKINGSHAGSLANLGQIYFLGGNEDVAEQYFQKAIEAGSELHLMHPNGTNLKVKIAKRPVYVSDGVISPEKEKRGGPACMVWLPAGEVYVAVESARGELGCYVVSDGGPKPWRVKFRAPSFVALEATATTVRDGWVADLIAILGSLDTVMGDCDR